MKHSILSRASVTGHTVVGDAVTEREKITQRKKGDEKIKLSFLSILVFLAALPSMQILNVVGQLYVTELALPLIAVVMVLFGKSNISHEKIFWQFVVASLLMIIGYIVSDIVAGTDPAKYLRGWGRNFILLADMVSLAIIFCHDRRLVWWFILGMSCGSILYLLLSHASLYYDWKLGYAVPVILLVTLMGYFSPKNITMLALTGIGVVTIFLDSRILGALCFVTAGVIFIRLKRPDGLRMSPMTFFRIVVAGTLVMALIISILNATKSEHGARRHWSNIGRFAALRISIEAISDSPILGYGSWGEGTEKYAHQLYDETVIDMLNSGLSNYQEGNVFLSHSQLTQAWMEGGILAATFFLVLGYQLIFGIKNLILSRKLDYLTPTYLYLLLHSLWDLVMSPYSGDHRLTIAISVALLCSLRLENDSNEQR